MDETSLSKRKGKISIWSCIIRLCRSNRSLYAYIKTEKKEDVIEILKQLSRLERLIGIVIDMWKP
ncbi:hypothetical protein [Bacillus methanolicus]|uniref:hypothetical protein n=1 Tax=Bacillus methanolicus TaxID=1471 RepID=UPI0012DD2CF2